MIRGIQEETGVGVDQRGLKVVGWPERADPRGGASPRAPVTTRIGKVDGFPMDLVVWRGGQSPPAPDAVWHAAGQWVALRHAAEAAG